MKNPNDISIDKNLPTLAEKILPRFKPGDKVCVSVPVRGIRCGERLEVVEVAPLEVKVEVMRTTEKVWIDLAYLTAW